MFEFLNGNKDKQREKELGNKVLTIEFREKGYVMLSKDGTNESLLSETPWNYLLAGLLTKEYFYRCMDTIISERLTLEDARDIMGNVELIQKEGLLREPSHTAFQMKLDEKSKTRDDYMKDFG